MKTRPLTADEVEFSIDVDVDYLPVRGNALASGDDAEDRACEDEIIRRLDDGDVWAWASVRVTARWRGYEGFDSLGACSYDDEADFREGGYFDDMKQNALDDLNATLASEAEALSELES